MADENGNARVTLATLEAQVTAIDRDYQDLRRAVLALDGKIDSSTAGISNRFDSAIAGLVNKIDRGSATPWQAIFGGLGVTATVLIAIGTALYMPIQRDTSRLDLAVSAILDRGVFQRQYEADQARNVTGFTLLQKDVNSTIQQQRYNTDQETLNNNFERLRKETELLRIRSYDNFGRLSAVTTQANNLDARLDAISRRLAEFIRDMGKH